MPLDHASHTDGDQQRWQPKAKLHVDALRKDGRHERHENKRHREPIPHQSRIVRSQMIVGGPTGRQHKAEKEENVRPSLAGIDETTSPKFGMPSQLRRSANWW